MASYRLRGNNAERIVILDSSAILMLFEFSINLEDELIRLLGKYRIVVPKPIVDEIKSLSKAGLKIIENYEIIDAADTKGDDSVLFLVKKLDGIAVTNDRELRKRIKDAGHHSIFLRNKSKLAIE